MNKKHPIPQQGINRFSPSRRRVLKLAPLAALAAGCDMAPGGRTESFLRAVQEFNDWVQARVFDPDKLATEYSDEEMTPESGFRLNSYLTDQPDLDLEQWRLTVDGLVDRPGEYGLEEIAAFPKRVMNTRLCCVEGWSMIPKWGGTTIRHFLEAVGADLTAEYVAVECGDGYSSPFDMPSILHPQSLLCYEAYGKPLTLEHGAPLRIVMPTKLGYKNSKWITRLTVTNKKPGGYWEDQGYEWFAGL